jgi:hypothetical protein
MCGTLLVADGNGEVGRLSATEQYLPTLTAVRPPSSSDALLPPPALLVMLRRLLLLGDGFIMALIGRDGKDAPPGDPGGEVAISAILQITPTFPSLG